VINIEKFKNRLKRQQILVPPLWKRNLQSAPRENNKLEKKSTKTTLQKEKIIKSTKISNWIQHNELLLKY